MATRREWYRAGEGNDRLAGLRLDVHGVMTATFRVRCAFPHDEVQDIKGVVGGRLAVLVVGGEAPTVV